MNDTKRLVILAVMVSQALILSIIESWIPIPAIVPGIKLGLANIITVVVIVFFGYKDAFMVVLVRCLLASIFGGGLIIFLFSLTGGLLSMFVMAVLYKKASKVFSLIGISISGSIMHNVGQITMACIIMKTISVLDYLPILLISGIIMGCFVGICSLLLCNALKKANLLV